MSRYLSDGITAMQATFHAVAVVVAVARSLYSITAMNQLPDNISLFLLTTITQNTFCVHVLPHTFWVCLFLARSLSLSITLLDI